MGPSTRALRCRGVVELFGEDCSEPEGIGITDRPFEFLNSDDKPTPPTVPMNFRFGPIQRVRELIAFNRRLSLARATSKTWRLLADRVLIVREKGAPAYRAAPS